MVDKKWLKLFNIDDVDSYWAKWKQLQEEIASYLEKKQNKFKNLKAKDILDEFNDYDDDFTNFISKEYGLQDELTKFIKSKWYDWVVTNTRTSRQFSDLKPENITIFNPEKMKMINIKQIREQAHK